jgi:hypothetical protein
MQRSEFPVLVCAPVVESAKLKSFCTFCWKF